MSCLLSFLRTRSRSSENRPHLLHAPCIAYTIPGVRMKRKRSIICRVHASPEASPGAICLSGVARHNLNARLDDFVTVFPVVLDQLREVTLCAIDDTVEGIAGGPEDLKRLFLDPFFATSDQMAVKVGDLLECAAGMQTATFKVVEVKAASTASRKDCGTVNPNDGVAVRGTVIICGEPISREKGEEDLNAIGYDSIGGLGEQLQKIRETIELPIRHPQVFRAIGVKPPKGVLMHGPPGCGKTLIARAIATEVGAEFKVINGPSIIQGGAGGPEAALKALFESAADVSPCIIFIDEIDSIAPNRDKTGDEKMRRLVATLLTSMDGLRGGKGVLVLGATNRPNSLDPALRRAGRFDTEVIIPVPSQQGRLEILQILTKKTKMADDVDLKKLASVTHGYVGADLQALCQKAAINCIRKKAAGVIDMDEEDLPPTFIEGINVTMKDFMGAIDATTPSLMRDVAVETPNVKFSDIGGLETVKQELREMIEMPLTNPKFFEDMGQQPPRGALMWGPPGCGKTMLAKAMANECSANFISVKGPQLLSKWFGEAEENVRDVFEKARQSSPCILFFDELDSIAGTRGGHGASSAGGAGDRVVNQLLTEMDGLNAHANLFVIGATNRPDTLDAAIRRPGRLGQDLFIPLPDLEARKGILRATLRKTAVARDADLNKLAVECDGMTGADLAGLCQTAVKLAVRRRMKMVIEGKIEEATLDVPVTADDFEVAYKTQRRSVSEVDNKEYADQAAAMNRSGSTIDDEFVPRGRYHRVAADAGAPEDPSIADEDVDEYY